MPTRRPQLFALLGAIVALTPTMAIGGSVDARVTASIPMPDVPQTPGQTSIAPDIAQLKSGLDALAANNIAGARNARDTLPATSLDRHILAWAIALYGGDQVPSGEIADAAKMLPGWPGTIALRKNSERALYRENPPPQVVVQAFGRSQPLTPEGVIILARSQVALGNQAAARAVLVPFWRTEKLESKDEATIIEEFGTLIPAVDHRYRMERMFYADRPSSALRVAGLAGAQPLADAWAAADKGDKNAAKLLKAVPAAQRSAGYFFAEAEYLRKQQKFADAAAVVMKAPTDRDSLVDPDAWWVERRVLSRELVDQGDMKTAYKIVSMHAAESPLN
ncbi:lytic transglycosylase domain-containing protein, partial [Mesorhizobium sp. M00.F.Ca.ET.149.01.1.1]